jgi:two-component system nitrate/nitrite response regulator NarP
VNGVLLKESAPALLRTCLDAVRNGGRWIDRSILEQALATSMEQEGRRGKLSALSVKERAIVGLITKGLRNRQIADELGLTEGTVKVHLHNIYAKLGVANRTELAMVAEREQP